MITNKTIIQDGQVYKPGEEVPDMGSLRAVSVNGNARKYEGLISDESKLPRYVGAGSSATLWDASGEVRILKYEETTGLWYRWGEGGTV